ncbi:MAG TPA: DUF2148 domain-containing protein [Chloroflexota bacterium]
MDADQAVEQQPLVFEDMHQETVRQAARAMAAAAITAPKSGGQLFLKGAPLFVETVYVEDRATLRRLAAWMRVRGRERQEAIWFRDAQLAEVLDGVLFVGLHEWYPPVYDCGACGYATCAEFLGATKALRQASQDLEFGGPQCNLRDIDLGIAVGSAARTASVFNVDCRCQTRIAVAARKLGIIKAEVAVALSLSVTHKSPGFDRPMPQVDFATLEPEPGVPPDTGTFPRAVEHSRRDGGRARQQRRGQPPVAGS